MSRFFHLLLLFAVLAMVSGCAGAPWAAALAPTVTPTPSATPAPTQTPAPSATPTASATPAPTATPLPTATPAPPTATFVPLDPTPTLAPLAAELRAQIFEEVWTTVRDNYLYEDYRGVDWQAAREEFAPRVEAAQTPQEFYELMRELIDRLGDDHSRFESPQEVAEQEAEFEGELRYSGIGAEIRDVDEGGLVITLAPGGPAERAGILPRDLVLAINGIPFNDPQAFGPDGPNSMVRGLPGTTVRLTVQTGNNLPRELEVLREPIDKNLFDKVRTRQLPGNIGLVEIPSFYVEGLDDQVRAAVEELLASGSLRGIVLDVRNNSGGYVHLMRNTIALFHDGGVIGTTSGRGDSQEQIISTGEVISGTAELPLAVLIGPDSASAAEMFAAGMRVLGRASIVGLPSAGNTENLYSYSFEDGSRLLIAQVAYRLPDGTLIEGTGVLPDREIDAEWWRYPPEADPQILAAVEELGRR